VEKAVFHLHHAPGLRIADLQQNQLCCLYLYLYLHQLYLFFRDGLRHREAETLRQLDLFLFLHLLARVPVRSFLQTKVTSLAAEKFFQKKTDSKKKRRTL
jgi:hypothetical protein